MDKQPVVQPNSGVLLKDEIMKRAGEKVIGRLQEKTTGKAACDPNCMTFWRWQVTNTVSRRVAASVKRQGGKGAEDRKPLCVML